MFGLLCKIKKIAFFFKRWGLAWSFLPINILDLSTAPVIRKNGKSIVQSEKSTLKETLITFPIEDKFSDMNDLISFLIATMKKLKVIHQ